MRWLFGGVGGRFSPRRGPLVVLRVLQPLEKKSFFQNFQRTKLEHQPSSEFRSGGR